MIQRWHWWHLHSHYWANPFWICFKSNGHSTEWILTGLVPIRISVLITSWITSTLILRHWIVQEMMEDQVMISICMDMKGMRNGSWSSPIVSDPDPSILWLYLIGSYKPVYSSHCHLHFLSHPDTTYPIESNCFSLLTNAHDTNPCCSPTIFRINREREERAVDLSLFSSPLEWWGRSPAWEMSVRSSPTTLSVDPCTILMRLPEAFWENETHRLRDSTLHTTGFHSSHSSHNLWSHWKWIEWNLACLKWWGSWRLVDWVFSGSWISRRFVRERRNRGWGLEVTAIVSDG